jgi:hypothetical protein
VKSNHKIDVNPGFICLLTILCVADSVGGPVLVQINKHQIEMYADPTARGGILEPEGIVEIKFRTPEIIRMMRRLDPELKAMTVRPHQTLVNSELDDEAQRFCPSEMSIPAQPFHPNSIQSNPSLLHFRVLGFEYRPRPTRTPCCVSLIVIDR